MISQKTITTFFISSNIQEHHNKIEWRDENIETKTQLSSSTNKIT